MSASETLPLDPRPIEPAHDRFEAAIELSDLGRFTEALELLEAELEERPSRGEAWTAAGWALENLGTEHAERARGAYRRAIALDPSDLWAAEGLANLLRRAGAIEEAGRLYVDVVRQAPLRTEAEPDLLELLGWCWYRLGDHSQVEVWFKRALEHDPSWISVWFDLGLARLAADDRDGAEDAYARGLDLVSRLEPARRAAPLQVAHDDLHEADAERPALAAKPEVQTLIAKLEAASAPQNLAADERTSRPPMGTMRDGEG